MTRMYLMARLALTALGVFIFLRSMGCVQLVGFMGDKWGPRLCSLGIFLLLSFLACRFLFWSDAWIARMIGPCDEESPPVSCIQAVGGFRIVLVFCGLLILSGRTEILIRAAAFIVVAPKIIVNMIASKSVDKVFYMPGRSWVGLIVNLAKAALGIYLILGAPRFVRWQMGRFYAPASDDQE